MHDTKTPAIMETLAVIVNVVLDFVFIYFLKNSFWASKVFIKFLSLENVSHIEIIALPLAYIIGDIFNLFIFLWIFSKKQKSFNVRAIFSSFWRVLLASLFMGGIVYNVIYYVEKILNTRTFIGIFLQGLISGAIGIIIYLIMCYLLNIGEVKSLARKLKKGNVG